MSVCRSLGLSAGKAGLGCCAGCKEEIMLVDRCFRRLFGFGCLFDLGRLQILNASQGFGSICRIGRFCGLLVLSGLSVYKIKRACGFCCRILFDGYDIVRPVGFRKAGV